MEKSLSLYHSGRLAEAIVELGAELRKQPASIKLRTFLFELLCFAGEFDRAAKQLDVLAEQDPKVELAAVLYRNLLQSHRQRENVFASGVEPVDVDETVSSVRINGRSYESCEDEDVRIGYSLEVYVNGVYRRIPFREITQMKIEKPSTLRDLFWIPAVIGVKEDSQFAEIGSHVYLPALAPSSWKHNDDAVRLGRTSVIEENENGVAIPYGAKLLICGDTEIPLLEVRELLFVPGEE